MLLESGGWISGMQGMEFIQKKSLKTAESSIDGKGAQRLESKDQSCYHSYPKFGILEDRDSVFAFLCNPQTSAPFLAWRRSSSRHRGKSLQIQTLAMEILEAGFQAGCCCQTNKPTLRIQCSWNLSPRGAFGTWNLLGLCYIETELSYEPDLPPFCRV
ncbi:uncharacterized protein LOC144458195 [Phascolarctos cinereus]